MPTPSEQTVKGATLSATTDENPPASDLRRELLRRFAVGPLWLSLSFRYAPALAGAAAALPRDADAAAGGAGDYEVLVDSQAGITVDENVFGWSILHGGQSYSSANLTPEGGAKGGKMTFKWSRMFADWNLVEKSPGQYDWTSGGAVGKNVQGRADYFAARNLSWVLVLEPGRHPAFYNGSPHGPPSNEDAYRNYVTAALNQFVGKGLRAIEMSNEPESGGWWGTLGHKPQGAIELRQAAREQAPWARVAKETVNAYNAAHGTRIEVWGCGCQSMADPRLETGLARNWCDPSPQANQLFKGPGFLNGPDGKGGTAIDWLDRFSFHGYPSPSDDYSLLPGLFLKARSWLKAAGKPDLPMAVTEHGVASFRFNEKTNKGDLKHREWKTDAPYTGGKSPMTELERARWVLTAFGIAAAYQARMIYYAWDEARMGIYGYNNGPNSGSPTAALGWLPEHEKIETKYNALRTLLLTPRNRIFQLRERLSDKQFSLLVGPDRNSATFYPLE